MARILIAGCGDVGAALGQNLRAAGHAGVQGDPADVASHDLDDHHTVVGFRGGVEPVDRIDSVIEQIYAITTERKLTHPAIVAISKAAQRDVFTGSLPGPSSAEKAKSRTATRGRR